jgi:tRNA(Ile)-lysidine synthase
MPALDARRRLLRPLLLTPARELKDFLLRCALDWFEDESNAKRNFRRNRVRHSLWPLLLEESPRLAEHIARLWRIARADDAYWEARLASILPTGDKRITLEAAALKKLEQAARLRLYMRAISRLGRGQGRAGTLFALDAAWSEGRGNTRFQFPGGVKAVVRKGSVSFFVEEGRK